MTFGCPLSFRGFQVMLHARTKEYDSRMNSFVKHGEMQFSHTVSVESMDLDVAPKASSVGIGTYERIIKMISTGSLSNWSSIVNSQLASRSKADVLCFWLVRK